jgi:long-chain fatty acid transport protein
VNSHYNTAIRALIGFTAALLAQAAPAAGFYISEVGTPGSLGTAGVANPVNTVSADSSWTNPAGMTGLQQDEMLAGLQVLLPKIEFDSSVAEAGGSDGGNAGNIAAIPAFFMVKKLNDRTRLGFSLVAPQGGAMNFGDDFVGRYGATKVKLAAIGGSPSIAYKVNDRLSLGGGVSIIYTQFEQSIAINQSALVPGSGTLPDGKAKFDNMTDLGYQPFAGLTYYLSDNLMLGIVYRAEMDVNLEGDLNFRNLAFQTPPADEIEIDWDNPQTLKAGLRYEIDPGKRLIFSANWEDWSAFSKNQLAITGGVLNPAGVLERNFRDTWSAGVAFVDGSNKTHGYSVGFSYDSSPVSNKDRTIDLPFDETYKLSAAYGWQGSKQLDFALGGTLMYFGEGKVDQTAQGVRFKGKFDTNMALFLGGTLRYHF